MQVHLLLGWTLKSWKQITWCNGYNSKGLDLMTPRDLLGYISNCTTLTDFCASRGWLWHLLSKTKNLDTIFKSWKRTDSGSWGDRAEVESLHSSLHQACTPSPKGIIVWWSSEVANVPPPAHISLLQNLTAYPLGAELWITDPLCRFTRFSRLFHSELTDLSCVWDQRAKPNSSYLRNQVSESFPPEGIHDNVRGINRR